MSHTEADVIKALLDAEKLFPRPTPLCDIPDPITPAARAAASEEFCQSWNAYFRFRDTYLGRLFPGIDSEQVSRCTLHADDFFRWRPRLIRQRGLQLGSNSRFVAIKCQAN